MLVRRRANNYRHKGMEKATLEFPSATPAPSSSDEGEGVLGGVLTYWPPFYVPVSTV